MDRNRSPPDGQPSIAAAGEFALDGDTTVTRLGFGAMRICGPDILGDPDDVAGARDVLRRAVALGVDFIDTADAYGPGTSERLLCETLHPYDGLTVATKGGNMRRPDGAWQPNGDPDYLKNACLCSLDRLGVDRIDLYQHHRPDPDTSFEDSVVALAELKDAGYIRHVGLSNVSVDQLTTARDHVAVATVQNRYNVTNREAEPVLKACEAADVGFMPWYPLAAGDLAADAIGAVARAHDATRAQVALAWLLDHSPVMLPIPGTADLDHLAENVAAAELTLTAEDRRRLDRIDPPAD